MREAWTDERLDDLNARVDDLGRRMDEGFARLDTRIDSLRTEMMEEIRALHRLVLQVGGATIATTMAGFLGIIATLL